MTPHSPSYHPNRRPSSNMPALHDSSTSGPPPPHHHRAPSLGEIHQELESEQEGQVNRLLGLIREQQAQISVLQHGQEEQAPVSSQAQIGSEQSSQPAPEQQGGAPSPSSRHSSAASSRRRPHTPLRTPSGSPGVWAGTSGYSQGGISPGVERDRDDTARVQAETAMVRRENEMLLVRVRELEKQLAERRERL